MAFLERLIIIAMLWPLVIKQGNRYNYVIIALYVALYQQIHVKNLFITVHSIHRIQELIIQGSKNSMYLTLVLLMRRSKQKFKVILILIYALFTLFLIQGSLWY